MTVPRIERRAPGQPDALPPSLHPVLRRVYAARGVAGDELELDLRRLLGPDGLHGIAAAASRVADAIGAGEGIVIAGDYDCDGATGVATAVLGLRALGAARVDYVVPDRFRMGYGLSPALAERAAQTGATLLITVDNGIASNAGVAQARSLGLSVVITDHHLAGAELPAADAIVNPNQPGCSFASKHLAGVGVMFYLLLAVRAQLRARGAFASRDEPRLVDLLDLVAIGTVADVVRLDHNNRVLVQQGLARIRAGRTRPGVQALLKLAGRDPQRLSATDLGFVLGPRINAAGRLDDIRTGIECLLAPDPETATPLAQQLDRFNRERREIEAQMRETALLLVADSEATGVCVFQDDWHEGIVGLVASKLKDRLHRPAFAFARAQEPGLLKGSGRSIPGLHLRDALVRIDTRHPGLLQRYGGHAMAAGLTIAEADYPAFAAAFDAVCRELLDDDALARVIYSDGELGADEFALATAQLLEQAGPWGQGFAEPLFEGTFRVLGHRVLKDAHVKYQLETPCGVLPAMHFGGIEQLRSSGALHLTYRLSINRWRDTESLELVIVDVCG
jgi:single-stranded-DNA-specific exonuclease